jgi:predicted chitinase/peptidoglycan hydrolase-like protein with peptidoglycan-binding domain
MYPRAPAPWMDAFLKLYPDLFDFYSITRLRWVHFAGQISEETNGLTLSPMRENMNYSASRMLQVYRKRLQICVDRKQPIEGKVYRNVTALANALQHKPELTADVVYGGREGTPWMQGHLYIGRGPTQCTHLDNYRALGSEIARQPGGGTYDLVANPDLLATDPELGVRAAFANFQKENLWLWADRDDCDTLSDALNTGNIRDNVKPLGLPARRRETARAKAIWPADAWNAPATNAVADARATKPAKKPAVATETASAAPSGVRQGDEGAEVERLQARLSELGFQVGKVDGNFGTLTRRALVAFQAEHDLQPDGVAGPRTWEVLAQSAPADLGDRTNTTAKDLATSGSRTVAITQKAKTWLFRAKGLAGGELVDQYFNLGIADNAITKVEHVKSLVTRGKDLTAGTPVEGLMSAAPTAGIHGLIMIGCLGVIAVAGILWLIFHSIETVRVDDARKGNNLAH